MVNASHTSFNANDRSYLAILKKEIHKLVVLAGFDQKKVDEIDIIVSELGSNLIKHASGGEILAGILPVGQNIALELIGIDNGPGIPDPLRMMQDGMSTTHTLGHGLGSIRRFSDDFELYSQRDWGTIVLSRIFIKTGREKKTPPRPFLSLRSLVIAKPGELVSGDGFYSVTGEDGTVKLLAADGLGHGLEASNAVAKAMTAFNAFKSESPAEIVRYLHTALKKTRGIVGTVILFDPVRKIWKLCGVGNIATRLNGFQQAKGYLSYNGIIGLNIPHTLNDQELSQDDFQQIILCSDGIKSRWEQVKLQDVHRQDLIVQAAALYKDFARKTDDMSITIGKIIS
jgi:anti-sigma regulatory factor (Ser/Thr protein kinase)